MPFREIRCTFRADGKPRGITRLSVSAAVPEATRVTFQARTAVEGGRWSDWRDLGEVSQLPAGHLVQIEASLHTDDGRLTPRLAMLQPVWR